MLILNMALNFTFVCNLEKLQVWQSIYPCIHLVIVFVETMFTNLENWSTTTKMASILFHLGVVSWSPWR